MWLLEGPSTLPALVVGGAEASRRLSDDQQHLIGPEFQRLVVGIGQVQRWFAAGRLSDLTDFVRLKKTHTFAQRKVCL